MKKPIQLLVILALVLIAIGVAKNAPAWASTLPADAAQPLSEITITESGSYTIGGLCQFNAVYTGSGASASVAVDVLNGISHNVPNSSEDELYLAGCHIVHFTMGEVTREMSPAYGSWEVCFGDRSDARLIIYYYLDNPENGAAVWAPLVTTVKDGFACAPANYSGVYAPGGKRIESDGVPVTGNDQQFGSLGGTVRPPSPINTGQITQSGTYYVGGVGSVVINYQAPNLSTVIHLEDHTEISAKVPFPDSGGLLYLPGIHLFHYAAGQLVPDVTPADGSWKICFASIPNKETTIYFYYANGETAESVGSDWSPLETTIENGMACAQASHTGVYAPAGK
jgi:hypothetical protein